MMKMIAVDNRPDRLTELADCLRRAFPEAEIEAFIDPGSAVQYSFKNQVDIAFTEHSMRRLDGIQVAEGIHFFQPETMIYLLTDAGAPVRKVTNKDVAGSFTRPLDAADIRKKVLYDHELWERKLRAKRTFVPSNSRSRRNEL